MHYQPKYIYVIILNESTNERNEKLEIITSHQSADFDSLAAMVAAKKLHKNAVMVFSGSVERNVRKYISIYGHMIEIAPLRNIKIQDVNKLIIVDTRIKRRLGPLAKLINKKDVEIYIYDHHPTSENDIVGKYNHIEEVGATTTILLKKIKEQNIEITPAEATLFALGIYEDTGSLTFSTTTIDDVNSVSYLFKKGIKLNVLNNFMNIGLNHEQKELMNQLLYSAKEIICKGVSVIIAKATADKYTEGLAFLTHKLMEIQNSDSFFTLVKMNENVYIVGRSKVNSVDVDIILNEMGGGGHFQAASAVVKNRELDDVEKQLIEILNEKIVLGVTAKNVMSSPVKTVDVNTSIEDTRKISLRYGHNGIPVMKQEVLKGIITMQELNRAKRHGFGKEPVSKFMSKRIIRVKQDEPVAKIQELMVSYDIGRILVTNKENKLTGIVTRTDLIRSMYGEDNIPKRSFSTYIENLNKKEKNNQIKIIKENFPLEIQNILHDAGKIGDRLKYPVFMVGGIVRDLFLGIKNYDLDIAVEGNGILFARELCKELKGRMKSYRKFNTAIIILANGFKIDIATARREFYEYPAALPKVELSSMKKDLYRRDFTINAMAIQLNRKHFGKLIDFFGGKKDLQSRVIRVLYNLSFVEDPARIIRAIRFEQRYGFKINKSTEYFLKKAIDDKLLGKLRRKRISEELMLILNETEPEKSLSRMMELEVIKFLLPGIIVDKKMIKKIKKVRKFYAYWQNNFRDAKIEIWLIYLICLLEDLDITKVQRFCKKLLLKSDYVSIINDIFLNYDFNIQYLVQRKRLMPSEIFVHLRKCNYEMLFMIMMKNQQKTLERRIINFMKKTKHETLEISGKDIEDLGIEPGPIYSVLLNKTLYAKMDGKIKNKEEEKLFVRTIISEKERKNKK